MKKYAFLTVLVAVFLLGVCGAALADNVSIVINGTRMTPDVPPQIIDGRTLVPLRFVSQALGAQVGWDVGTQTAIVRKNFTTNLPVDVPVNRISDQRLKLEVNGKLVEGVPLVVVDDRVMVPLRVISETFGADVRWDGETRTVLITMPNTGGAGGNDPNKEQSLKLLSEGLMKLQNNNEYSFTMNSTLRFEVSAEGEQMKAVYEGKASGAIRKPEEVYMKYEMNLLDFQAPDIEPGIMEPNDVKATVEVYVKGNKVYAKVNDGQWESGCTDQSCSVNVQKLSDMRYIMELYSGPSVRFAPVREIRKDGKDYLVLSGSIGGIDFSRFLANTGFQEIIAEIREDTLQDLLKDTRASFEYWVDKNSMILSGFKAGVSGTVKVPVSEDSRESNEVTISVDIQAEGTYGVGIPFQIPVLG